MFVIPNLKYSNLKNQLENQAYQQHFYFKRFFDEHIQADFQNKDIEIPCNQVVDLQPQAAKVLVVQEYQNLVDWQDSFEQMLNFTHSRDADNLDQVLFLEHKPVLTQGIAGKSEHILANWLNIPVYQADRGGQVTYHGPKQQIIYLLVDFYRKKKVFDSQDFHLYARNIVTMMEQAVVKAFSKLGLPNVHARADAPGIYVEDKKISSLGLKVTKLGTYHGIAINLDMNLLPFKMINPCGYSGLEMCNLFNYQNHPTNKFVQVVNSLDSKELARLLAKQIWSQDYYQQVKSLTDWEPTPSINETTNTTETIQTTNLSLNSDQLYKVLCEFIREYFLLFMQYCLGYKTIVDGRFLTM